MRAAPLASLSGQSPAKLEPLAFRDLAEFDADDHLAAFSAFARTAEAISANRQSLRPARRPSRNLKEICHKAFAEKAVTATAARRFFTENFRPFRLRPRTEDAPRQGFATAYFEPVVAGSFEETAEFSAPVLARPDDLVTLGEGETLPGLDPALRAARKLPDGSFSPYPDRAQIEAGAIAAQTRPILWLRDPLEVFLVQVQGSARVVLPDGKTCRLVYAGRNGQPYSSLGRMLIDRGEVSAQEMGLARLKAWIHAQGMHPGDPGGALMQRNRSYVFFALDNETADPQEGPIGGAGVRLAPLRSIAVDRSLWSYGLPFWISADLPWQGPAPSPFRRLTIAQDTGSAILGPARADIFFGTGDEVGRLAGEIRHDCDVVVLLPRGDAEGL
jgi:membrane-bound lytic murein transglycosylase A